MPFFEPAGESDDSFGKKGPPPIAKKPKAPGGYDSEEDRYLRHSGEVNIANIRLTEQVEEKGKNARLVEHFISFLQLVE